MNCHKKNSAFVVRGDKNLVARATFAHAQCSKGQEKSTEHEIGNPHGGVVAEPHITKRNEGTHDSNEQDHDAEQDPNKSHRSKNQSTDNGNEWSRGVITHETNPSIDEIDDCRGPIWVGEWIRNH